LYIEFVLYMYTVYIGMIFNKFGVFPQLWCMRQNHHNIAMVIYYIYNIYLYKYTIEIGIIFIIICIGNFKFKFYYIKTTNNIV
jgi:hypothetical protein